MLRDRYSSESDGQQDYCRMKRCASRDVNSPSTRRAKALSESQDRNASATKTKDWFQAARLREVSGGGVPPQNKSCRDTPTCTRQGDVGGVSAIPGTPDWCAQSLGKFVLGQAAFRPVPTPKRFLRIRPMKRPTANAIKVAGLAGRKFVPFGS